MEYNFKTTVGELTTINSVNGTVTVAKVFPRVAYFSFTATVNGNETFTLETAPIVNSLNLAIDALQQNAVDGDFTVSGDQLTVNNLKIGEKVYGQYQY